MHRTGNQRGGAIAAAVVVLAAVTPVASAQPEAEPAAIFDRALELHERGEFENAAREFMNAYELAPTGDAAYNAAVAWEAARQEARAADAYDLALTHELTRDAKEDATKRLVALSKKLGLIEVTAPEGSEVSVGGRLRTAPRARFYVTPGEHTVSEGGPGQKPRTKTVTVAAGQLAEVTFDRRPEAVRQAPPPEPDRTDAPESVPWTTIGWVGVGTGGSLAIAATVLGLQTLDARDDYNASGFTDKDARDRTVRLQTWTNVAWVSAVLVGGAGATILLLRPGDSKEVSVRVGPGTAAIGTRF